MSFQGDEALAGTEFPVMGAEPQLSRTYWLLLAAILLLSLVVRWSLLGERWINPDEGAHLMGASLALQGYVPEVDYGTRQPFYVYALAGVLGSLGSTLTAGRLFPLACSLLTGVMLYLLGSALVDKRVGFVAGVVYLLLPLEVLQSVVVKTEAPVTLLVVSGIYAGVAAHRRRRGYLFVVSGLLAGLGFYIRETALLVPVVVAAFLALAEKGSWRPVLKSMGLFGAGYAIVVLLAAGFYAPMVSPASLWDMTPMAVLVDGARDFGPRVVELAASPRGAVGAAAQGPELAVATGQSWQGYGEPTQLYLAYLQDAILFHAFLFAGLALATVSVLRAHGPTDRNRLGRDRRALVTLCVWLGTLGLMYVYRYLTRGFFIDYVREFLPALVLALALGLCRVVPALRDERNVVKLVLVALSAGAAWYLLQSRFPDVFGLGHHATLAAALLAVAMIAFSSRRQRKALFLILTASVAVSIVLSRLVFPSIFSGIGPSAATMLVLILIMATWYRAGEGQGMRRTVRFVGLAVVAAAFAISLSYSALRLHVGYEAVWPPEEAREVAELISAGTEPEAEVMSGAVIWAFMASRRPFQLISHPLGLKRAASADRRADLRTGLLEDPPEIVVMDGYTEVTFARNVPLLDTLIARSYEQIASSERGFRPVRVYRLVAADGHSGPGDAR